MTDETKLDRLHILLSPAMRRDLERYGERNGRTVSDVVREAIADKIGCAVDAPTRDYARRKA